MGKFNYPFLNQTDLLHWLESGKKINGAGFELNVSRLALMGECVWENPDMNAVLTFDYSESKETNFLKAVNLMKSGQHDLAYELPLVKALVQLTGNLTLNFEQVTIKLEVEIPSLSTPDQMFHLIKERIETFKRENSDYITFKELPNA